MVNSWVMTLEESYLIYLVAGKEYGINIKILSSIINPLQNYSLGKSFNIGSDLIRIDNQDIPFYDFYHLYNVTPPPQSKDTRIIVVNIDNLKTAFFVEQVKGFISFDINNFPQSEHASKPCTPLIKWQIKYCNRDILFPEFDKIIKNSIRQNILLNNKKNIPQ